MLHLTTREELLKNTSLRKGETKLGETLQTVSSLDGLKDTSSPFVLLGIKEDIGIKANLGKGGAANSWDYALKALCNVQENRFNKGSDIIVLGSLLFDGLLEKAEKLDSTKSEELEQLRELTADIDQQVSEVIRRVIEAGKYPIIIGGGHNNAYGNLKGVSEALGKPVNALNIDPHSDYRAMEGRHSGNGFHYARQEGYLNKYAVWGLHENYNSEAIIKLFEQDHKLRYQTFDALMLFPEEEKYRRLVDLTNWFGKSPLALELDMDSIANFPVSAMTPTGFTLNEIRQLVIQLDSLVNSCYFHICEASPGRASSEIERELIGKSLAYLITDFVKSH